jgi:hypothetical protein
MINQTEASGPIRCSVFLAQAQKRGLARGRTSRKENAVGRTCGPVSVVNREENIFPFLFFECN